MTSGAHAARERLNAAAGTGDLLAAGWDGFELLRTLTGQLAAAGPDGFPALMMAAAAAAAGRDAVGFAPSMPAAPGPASLAGQAGDSAAGTGMITELAAVLASRMRQAAARPGLPGDRAAFEQAAVQASAICDLLLGE